MAAGGGRAVCLLRARPTLHHRVDGLQVARVGNERDRDLARLGIADAIRAEVVLHVTCSALGTADDRIRHALSLELAEDRLIGLTERVGEHAEATAVRHAHDDAVRALARSELDRLVEHRHERIQTLDGELLLAEERPTKVLLERLDGRQPLEQPPLLLRSERLTELARLDRPAQPSPLLMVGDVLDLVRDRPAVRLLEQGQRLGERLRGDVQAEQLGWDLALELGRQVRRNAIGVELRVSDRLRAERVEACCEYAMRAVGVDERHRRRHCGQQVRRGRGGRWCLDGCRLRRRRSRGRRRRSLGRDGGSGLRRSELSGDALGQHLPPLLRNRLGILEVVVEQRGRVAGVEAVDISHGPRLPAERTATREVSR